MTNFKDGTQSINKIDSNRTNYSDARCFRCGAVKHKNDKYCPAKDKECLKCLVESVTSVILNPNAELELVKEKIRTPMGTYRKVVKKTRFDTKDSHDFKENKSKQQPASKGKTNVNYIFYMDDELMTLKFTATLAVSISNYI